MNHTRLPKEVLQDVGTNKVQRVIV